jgi:ABC-2 type transport system permease protein
VQGFADQIDTYVDYKGTTTDPAKARKQLVDNDIDLIVTFPEDPLNTVLGGKRAAITVTHTRIDPIEQTAINFAAQLAVDQFNGRIIAGVVQGGQQVAQNAGGLFQSANSKVDDLDAALARGDNAQTAKVLDDLDQLAGRLSLSVNASSSLTKQLGASSAANDMRTSLVGPTQQLQALIDQVRADPSNASKDSIKRMHDLLSTISGNYKQFTSVDSAVLVQPFETDVQLAVPGIKNATDWYAPAAVVLMLQQFGVAFGALSFVRERQLGIVDVYRVAPVNATDALVGKYLAYLPIGALIGAALTGLMVAVLGVPGASSVSDLVIVMALSLFASIGLGFVISLASSTDAQAVQYTMIVLLASLFFSGFFLSLGQLEGVAKAVSWLLPVSYGMELLRDVMLRGAPINRNLALGLGAYGVVAFALALLGTRRRMGLGRA